MKFKKVFPAFIGVGSVWLATAFGPGFSSGTLLNAFFTKHGFFGIFTPFLSMLILGLAIYFAIEFSRIYKVRNFRDYADNLYSPWQKILGALIDFCFLYTIVAVLGACLAAGGEILERFWSIPYWWGIAGLIIIGGIFCIFGAELVRRASSYIMISAIIIILTSIIMVIIVGNPDLEGAIVNNAVHATNPSLLAAIWSAILFAAHQSCAIPNIVSVTEVLKSKNDSKKAALFGSFGNILLMVPMIFIMFSFTNKMPIIDDALPLYSVLQTLNIPWLTTIYVLIVLMAIISSIFAFIYAGIARYEKYVKISNEKIRAGTIAAFILIVCVFIASFGFLAIVSVGFIIMAYISLPLILLPALFVARHKISKKYQNKHKKPIPIE